MKRAVILVAVLLLAISSLAVVGCGGGDTETAKKYMKTADSALADLEKKMEDLEAKAMTMLMPLFTGDTSTIKAEDLPVLQAELVEVTEDVDTVKADYEKITTLEGVPDYVEYADAMVAYLDAVKASLEESTAMYDEIVPVIDQALKTGDMSGLTALQESLMSTQTDMAATQEEMDSKKKEAEKIKKEKNLSD